MLKELRYGFVNIACLGGLIAFIQTLKIMFPKTIPIIWWILFFPPLIYFLISLPLVAIRLMQNKPEDKG